MTNRATSRSGHGRRGTALVALCMIGVGVAALQGCGATQIDRHGHLFTDVDLDQIQEGMSKDQVRMMLGTPDTTGTIDGDVYYYISSTRRTRPLGKPKVIDRKVLAIYFDQQQSVEKVANYGLKDGVIFDFAEGKTPSSGKELTAIEQIFGNIANRRELIKQNQGAPGRPGP